ncbi:DUF1302 domain-containing protein [Nitrogeniibacter aestuarii]|uniref:DUF1302 domain-containing protein n=1 Tax=Nitrogeniibacter aestuarii TaxID=2815343 RepID=UPI001D104087|nr:DUF1302 domain-containing protein [Nitrogeniibacter aestuarii]
MMHPKMSRMALALSLAIAVPGLAHAFNFDMGEVTGSLDSTVTLGFGIRTEDPSCRLTGDTSSSCGASANTAVWSNADDGNLNYDKGDFFTLNLKGSHELLLNLPNDWRFLGRIGWLHDFAADETARTDLDSEAKRYVGDYVRLYDLWVSKQFSLGGQRARVRVGNQVVSWGESLFMFGGINSNVAMDLQRLSSPGVQLKEAFLPSPMVSFATGLGNGMNLEAYYQFKWRRYEYPPAGTYFSQGDTFDRGRDKLLYIGTDAANISRLSGTPLDQVKANLRNGGSYPAYGNFGAQRVLKDDTPKDSGQFGVSLKFRPEGWDTDFGIYYQRYHDKTPNVQYWNPGATTTRMTFSEDRELYGLSANTTLGNWAVGTELSYRPKDAVSGSICLDANGAPEFGVECNSAIDNERYQWHLTGILSLTPGDHGWFLDAVGAQTGTFLGEAVAINYPGVNSGKAFNRTSNGVSYRQLPAAGAWTYSDASGNVKGVGDAFSWGYMFDFSLTYDSTVIPGWQVIPGVFFSHGVKGNTPNFVANWMEGAKSASFYVLFNRNPMTWQAGINYAKFWGGDYSVSAPFRDRDFIGGFISRNF